MLLSILLPSYNNYCLPLVETLQRQAEAVGGLEYEIIVADDGGTDIEVKRRNESISALPHCRYIIREKNVGRAAIRNFLASESKGDYVLFIDSDVIIVIDDFINRYLAAIDAERQPAVIEGGVKAIGDKQQLRGNLRFWYEYTSAPEHTVEKRNEHPYQSTLTTNLLVPSTVFAAIKFDERISRYGYEDVLFGKRLWEEGIRVRHIDAPVCWDKFDTSEAFIHKTHEALQTLHDFQTELSGFSSLLDTAEKLNRLKIRWAMRLFHRLFSPLEKRILCSSHPSLLVFKIYKLGYFVSL